MAGMTATEIIQAQAARYRDDPEHRDRIDADRSRLNAIAAERRHKLVPFNEALAVAGVTETYDRTTGKRHDDPRIYTVAFEHLDREGYDDETRAWIARSFCTRGAYAFWSKLSDLYLAAQGSMEREALAAGMSTCARSVHVADMKSFVQDSSLGSSRIFFLRPINRLDRKGGRDFVLARLDDPVLGKEADAIRRRVSSNS